MQIGQYQLRTVSGGNFRIDGGTLFGVVPKRMWSKVMEPDQNNAVASRTNCLLIESSEKRILVDTGYGSHLSEKQRRHISAEAGAPLFESLDRAGVEADQIDIVILTHLHFDHVGGALVKTESGEFAPAFPNAQHFVQAGEWEQATGSFPELKAAYSSELLRPLKDADLLTLLDGDSSIIDGIRVCVTPGHTPWHQSVVIESDDQTAVYLGDLCPTTRHLPMGWCMSFDVDLLEVRRQKHQWLSRITEKEWWALFDHDPDFAAARLAPDHRKQFRAIETIHELA